MAGSEGYSTPEKFGWPKAILIFLIVAVAISSPAFVAKTGIFNKVDPAWFSLVVGVVVGLVSWATLKLFMPSDFDRTSLTSTSVVLGLIAAHVCVFEISDQLPRAVVYLLFGFVFYYHFTAQPMFQNSS